MSFISSSSSSPYSNFSTALNSPTPNLLSLDSAETLSPPSTSSCFYGVPDYLQCHTSDYTMPPHEFAGDYSTSVNPYFASFQQFQAYNNCWMAQNVYNTTYPTPPSTPPDDETNAPDSTKEELPESTEFPDFVDTIELCKQIRETMKTDGISQVEFAKNVLNRGQGTFSQILKCPKPWKELDAGRRVYVQMKRWLEQSQEVRVAMAKGRGGKECKENNDAVPEAQNKRKSPDTFKEKRHRFVFKASQKNRLESEFLSNKHPTPVQLRRLAKEIGLGYDQVQVFFLNQRRRQGRRSGDN